MSAYLCGAQAPGFESGNIGALCGAVIVCNKMHSYGWRTFSGLAIELRGHGSQRAGVQHTRYAAVLVVVVLVSMAMMGIRVVRMTVTQGFMRVAVVMASHKCWNVSVRMVLVHLCM